MVGLLRKTCRELLESHRVQAVIGYGQKHAELPPYPVFITSVEDIDQLVWNDECVANLTTYLTRKDVKRLGKVAVIVKGCDAKALVVLQRESQIDRSQIVVVGVACNGVVATGRRQDPTSTPERAAKCKVCDVHVPQFVDITIGEAAASETEADKRYPDLDLFLTQSPDERMAYWQEELSRCIKCYACRQACPLCYCEQCIVDKNRPTRLSTSATLKGNYAWQITRAFHLAGRCIGCDECTRACPAGINLRLLNQSLAKAAEQSFAYRAGMDPDAEPVVGAFSEQDKESFIQ
jgi:ferredoxin